VIVKGSRVGTVGGPGVRLEPEENQCSETTAKRGRVVHLGDHAMAKHRNHHCPKLTWEKVREIRRLRAAGLTLSQLQARFGVSRQWVCKILKGDVWKEPEHRVRKRG